MMAEDSNVSNIIDVEILLKNNSLLSEPEVIALVDKWMKCLPHDQSNEIITHFDDPSLQEHISSINIQTKNSDITNGNFYKFNHYVYRFNSYGPEIEAGEDEQQISMQWILPTEDFHGLWESLFYDDNVKNELLKYVFTALLFSEKNIDSNVISWNRIVLLHGPPGTGKTSLCKALAQKISIQFKSHFKYGHFVEVNTHSLFSKWFSESGKLVTKMFQEILTLLEDPEVLVIVLLDEVESLARSRASALTGNEPSDALRVVNALLTHLDTIKRYPNVLILTTSNITEAIDVALIDRADIKQYIGLPSAEAIFQIYYSCIKELVRAGIIITGGYQVQFNWLMRAQNMGEKTAARISQLKNIAEKSKGLSGRSLRKIPFVAYALFVKDSATSVDAFLDALDKAVEKHWNDVRNFKVHI